jgi:hypothetical protein
MRIGNLLRDPQPKVPDKPVVDGLPNFHALTVYNGVSAPFGSGINIIRLVKTGFGAQQ